MRVRANVHINFGNHVVKTGDTGTYVGKHDSGKACVIWDIYKDHYSNFKYHITSHYKLTKINDIEDCLPEELFDI